MRLFILITALAALLLLGGAYILHAHLPAVNKELVEFAVERTNVRGSFNVEVGSIEPGRNGLTSLRNIDISGDSGLLMTLQRVDFSWSPSKLLSGELLITQLELTGVSVMQWPLKDKVDSGSNPLEALQRFSSNLPSVPIPVTISAVRLERVSISELEVSGKANLAYADRLYADADLTLSPHRDAGPTLHAMLGDAADLQVTITGLAGRELEITQAGLNSSALAVTASGTLVTASGGSNVALSLTAGPALATLVDGVLFEQVQYDGNVTGQWDSLIAEGKLEISELSNAQADVGNLSLDTIVERTANGVAFNISGWAEALSFEHHTRQEFSAVKLSAAGNLAGNRLALEQATLETDIGGLRGTGAYELADRSGSLVVNFETPALAPLLEPYAFDVQGAAVVDANISLRGNEDPAAGIRIDGQARITEAYLGGRRYGDLDLDYSVAFADTLEGDLALAMQDGWLGAGSAETQFRYFENRLSLSGVRIEILNTSLESKSVAIDTDWSKADGVFSLASDDLVPLSSFLGFDATGKINGKLIFSHDRERQKLNARLALPDLSMAGNQVGRTDIKIDVDDLFNMEDISLTLAADSARIGDVTFGSIQASATGKLNSFDYSVSAEGDLIDYPVDIRLDGRTETGGNVSEITLSSASLLLGAEKIHLRSPVMVRFSGGRIDDAEFELVLAGGGSVNGNLNITSDGIHGVFLTERLPVSTFNRFAQLPVSGGYLDLEARFDTGAQQTAAGIRMRGRNIVPGEVKTGNTVDIDLDADWDGERLDILSEIRGDFDIPARARLALGAGKGKYGLPAITENSTLDGTFTWRGRLNDIRALVPLPGHQFDGDIDLDLRVAGTIGASQFSGRGELARGEYQNVLLGVAISDIKVRADARDGARIDFVCEATDGDQGRITGSGVLQLQDVPSIDAEVRVDGGTLVRRDDVTARLSGITGISGPFNDLALTGKLHVDDAEILLLEFNPLEEVELQGIGGGEHVAPESAALSDVSLDLAVQAESSIFVRGRGVDSEWRADLTVTGDTKSPVLLGSIEKIRGRLDMIGKPLDLTRGRITFDGTGAIDPLIDVALERVTQDLHGGIYVSGRVSNPRVRFASQSGLPEDEVLPRLIFGVARQSLTTTQAIRLSIALAILFGNNLGLQNEIRAAAQLDSLQIYDTPDDGAYIILGKNLGERVFVGARQDIGGRGSSVTIEVEMTDSIIMDSELKPDEGSNIGIKWHKDF
ncbi:MAG: translocation/assembly module TamB domain-containing protein [Gammaproteobacteria bacterium]|nr:translocation/assembly module TamB domain-containing protein [Gammaproteobacteria bacterium]